VNDANWSHYCAKQVNGSFCLFKALNLKRTIKRAQADQKMKPSISLFLLALTTAPALATPRPVVVELFTSQACSDCPPADALLKRVQAQNPDVLALDLHVTYWNGAAWTDPYALQTATDLQSYYATLAQNPELYTPEAVVDGQKQFVGSDSATMATAIDQARASIPTTQPVPVSITAQTDELTIQIGPGKDTASISLFGFDPEHTTKILGGENGGATLSEINVVRSITPLGAWHGQPETLKLHPPAGEKFAVLLQKPDGTILGAASN
jgi:hypothetical protein